MVDITAYRHRVTLEVLPVYSENDIQSHAYAMIQPLSAISCILPTPLVASGCAMPITPLPGISLSGFPSEHIAD